ncbi:MAG: ABC transporter permease [Chloroflexota bacterium]
MLGAAAALLAALSYAIVAGLVAASSGLFLAWRFTQMNINNLKRVNKTTAKAWWQRAYLDVLVFGIALYVLYTLYAQEGINSGADTPFSNPLVFIGPTLFSLGLTLFFLRIFPMILSILSTLVGITSNIPVLMALRELTRNIGSYRGTLLMTVFTLALAGYTASMASTLDQSLQDVIEYRVGAEMTITTITDAQTEESEDTDTGETSEEVTGYNAPPVSGLWNLNEVAYLSRVGDYNAQMTVTGQRLSGVAIGIDREGLGGVTYMRDDYSNDALGAMLNELASNRTGIIISQQTATEYGIEIGQEVIYQIDVLGEWTSEIRSSVVGYVEYFPTIDPAEYDFFLLTALQPLFEYAGTPLPFNAWVDVADGYTVEDAQQAILETDFPVLRFNNVESQLVMAQAEPGRRGVFGFLSVGFVASIVLTLIGAIIQSTASLQAQASQLGSLRAMGMGSFSVRLYVLLIQLLIAIGGVGSGTLIGVVTTQLFLPMFDFSGGLPPYQLRLAWNDILLVYGFFGAVLVLVALFMAFILTRQQLSQSVKIGTV